MYAHNICCFISYLFCRQMFCRDFGFVSHFAFYIAIKSTYNISLVRYYLFINLFLSLSIHIYCVQSRNTQVVLKKNARCWNKWYFCEITIRAWYGSSRLCGKRDQKPQWDGKCCFEVSDRLDITGKNRKSVYFLNDFISQFHSRRKTTLLVVRNSGLDGTQKSRRKGAISCDLCMQISGSNRNGYLKNIA